MTRYALLLEYDGRAFAGFQFQADEPTVQGVVEAALQTILRHPARLDCAGRTDSGVHATGQVASFQTSLDLPRNRYRFLRSLNALLPDECTVLDVGEAGPGFHPRFSCVARQYRYLIWNDIARPAVWRRRCCHVRHSMDCALLNAELEAILGERDFAALTRAEYAASGETTVRYLHSARLQRIADPLRLETHPSHEASPSPLIALDVIGNAFLHNMIRILAGTLIDRSRGKLAESLPELIASKQRTRTGTTAPADGLYFRAAYYPPQAAGDARFLQVWDGPLPPGPRGAGMQSDTRAPERPGIPG